MKTQLQLRNLGSVQGVGAAGGVAADVPESDAGFTLVDERFSGPD